MTNLAWFEFSVLSTDPGYAWLSSSEDKKEKEEEEEEEEEV